MVRPSFRAYSLASAFERSNLTAFAQGGAVERRFQRDFSYSAEALGPNATQEVGAAELRPSGVPFYLSSKSRFVVLLNDDATKKGQRKRRHIM